MATYKTYTGSTASTSSGASSFRVCCELYFTDHTTYYSFQHRYYVEVTKGNFQGTTLTLGWTTSSGSSTVTLNGTGTYGYSAWTSSTNVNAGSSYSMPSKSAQYSTSSGSTIKSTFSAQSYTVPSPTYTVTYNANGGSGSMSSSTATYNKAFTTRQNTFTRAGYTFNGWNEDADGSGTAWKLTSAGVYESGKSWTWTYTKNITLYAQWVSNGFTVTYDANGGTGAPEPQTKTAGTNLALSTTKPTKSNTDNKTYTVTYNYNGGTGSPSSTTVTGYTMHTFKNWNTNSSGTGTSYNSGGTYSTDADVTLYAQWTSTVVNGGTTLPTPTRTNYTFGGWYSNSSLTTKAGDAGTLYTPTGNVTLYAKWASTDYTVTYNANGGTGAPASQTKKAGTALTLSTTKPTRSNSTTSYTVTYNHNYTGSSNTTATATTTTSYSFKNWNTNSNGTGTSYSSGGRYTTDASVTLYAQWNENKSGGSVALPTPTRNNYEFGGWYSNSSLTTKVGDGGASYTPSGNITLYAKWNTVTTYTVSYNANGGTGAPNSQTKTKGTALTLSTTKPTRSNSTTSYTVTYNHNYTGSSNTTATATTTTSYTFNNWNTNANGNGTSYSSGGRYTTDANVTLYAQWNESKSGGSITLATPTRNGYNFGGWYSNNRLTTKVGDGGASYTPTGNVTLYAKWDTVSYTISYDANGGSGAPQPQSKTHGTNITLSNTKPTRNNTTANGYTVTYNYNSGSGSPSSERAINTTSYTFKNWNTNSNGTGTSYNSGATYSANADATLYAQWNSTTTNGSVTLPTPTRTNYTFGGWYSNSSLTTKVGDAGSSYTPTGNVTLYAKWTGNSYTIKYDANGGTGAPNDQTKTHGVNLTLSATKPSRGNSSTSYTVTYNYNSGSGTPANATATTTISYTFNNWNTNANGSGTPYNSGATYSTNSDVTLYAQWTTSSSGGSVTLPTPTRNGYSFDGWYSNSYLANKVGNAGASYAPSGNVTLYAKWTANKYTVSYNANGGSGAPNSQEKTHGTALTLSTTQPTRDNYTFKGWATSSTATSAEYQAGGRYTVDSSVTLYAVWELDSPCIISVYDSRGVRHDCVITVYDSSGKARTCIVTPY